MNPQTEKPLSGLVRAFRHVLDRWRESSYIHRCRDDGFRAAFIPLPSHPSQDRDVQAKTLPLAVDPGLSLKDVDRGPKSCHHRKPFPEIVLRTYQGANRTSKTNNIFKLAVGHPNGLPTSQAAGLHGVAMTRFTDKPTPDTEESRR